MTILRGLILAVTLVSIFAISVVTILKVIKLAEFFSGRSRALIAVSLSILFFVALSQFLVWQGGADDTAGYDGGGNAMTRDFLLPGVALGIAAVFLLSQVLLLANRMPAEEKPEPFAKKPYLAVVKSNSQEKPKKKEKPVEKPSKEPPKTTGKVAK